MSVTVHVDCAPSECATSAKRVRSSSTPNGSESARTSWRVKNQPVSGSVWYAASTIQPPLSARNDEILAMMPVRSGQPKVIT